MNGTSEKAPTVESAFAQGQHPLPVIVDQVEEIIRKHPFVSVFASIGLGCAMGLAVRELFTPPPPKNRALALLEDIQSRLADYAEPVRDRVSSYADDGVEAVKKGIHSVSESKFADRIRHLFS